MVWFERHRKSLEHHPLVANIKHHAGYYALAGFMLIILFLFRKPLIKIFFLFIMLTLGSFSTFYKRFGDIPIGFELMTLFGVVIALTYSLFLGILSVILMTFFSYLITSRVCVTMFLRMVVFVIAVLIGFIFQGFGIATTGLIVSITMNVIFLFLWLIVMRFNPVTAIISTVLNTIINIFLFSTVGVWLVSLLG